MNYQQKPVKVNAVQYGLAEYADNPLVFKDGVTNNGTQWVEDLYKEGNIAPVFKSQDYWYLKIDTPSAGFFVEPDEWLIQSEEGKLSKLTDKEFKRLYEPCAQIPMVAS